MPHDGNPASGSQRLAVLQVYRAIAAISVLLLHVNGKFTAPHYYGAQAWNTFLWGRMGVDFFFVLSGFIVTEVVARRPTPANFFYNRFVRIYPPFWLAFGVTLVVATFMASELHSPVRQGPKELILAALLLPQDFEQPPVLTVAWTLWHEILFYGIMGLSLVRPRIALAVATLLLAGALRAPREFPASFFFSPLHWEFLMGFAVSRWGSACISQRWARPLLAAAGVALVVACVAYDHGVLQSMLARVGIFGVLFAVVIATSVVAERQRPLFGSRFRRVMAALGDSSYVLYLWHIPLAVVVAKAAHHLFPAAQGWQIVVLSFAIAAVVALEAHLIHLLAERPLIVACRRVAGELSRLWQGVRIQPR